jgi:glucokinase
MRALDWAAGTRLLTTSRDDAVVVIRRDPGGSAAVDRGLRIRIPGALRAWCEIRIGDPLLLAANPAADLLLAYPIPLVDRLQGTYQVPVAIDTDAVAAALGEYRYGRAAPPRSMLVVTLGTGIGSCLLIDGIPFRGGDSIPPEGGHLTVPNAPPCYCGRPHCFEQSASRAALERIAVATTGHNGQRSAALPALCAMADQGHPDALRAFKIYGTALGDGLSTLLEVYRPSEVVLAGSGASYMPYFKQALEDVLTPLAPWVATAWIRATQLGDLSGALGAAELAARVTRLRGEA